MRKATEIFKGCYYFLKNKVGLLRIYLGPKLSFKKFHKPLNCITQRESNVNFEF